jgi:hypothetical protein
MKKQLLTLAALSLIIPSFSSYAATYNAGTFHPVNPDGDYSIETSGVFWDEFDFRASSSRWYCGGQNISMSFSGTHTGMYNDELLLINLNTRATYTLDETFDVTINNLRNDQRFAITGSGLSATDPSILSAYNLSLESVPSTAPPAPAPVPLPAAAWLFASGMVGFATIKKKKSSS